MVAAIWLSSCGQLGLLGMRIYLCSKRLSNPEESISSIAVCWLIPEAQLPCSWWCWPGPARRKRDERLAGIGKVNRLGNRRGSWKVQDRERARRNGYLGWQLKQWRWIQTGWKRRQRRIWTERESSVANADGQCKRQQFQQQRHKHD